jgi:hypothetical protein
MKNQFKQLWFIILGMTVFIANSAKAQNPQAKQ